MSCPMTRLWIFSEPVVVVKAVERQFGCRIRSVLKEVEGDIPDFEHSKKIPCSAVLHRHRWFRALPMGLECREVGSQSMVNSEKSDRLTALH